MTTQHPPRDMYRRMTALAGAWLIGSAFLVGAVAPNALNAGAAGAGRMVMGSVSA